MRLSQIYINIDHKDIANAYRRFFIQDTFNKSLNIPISEGKFCPLKRQVAVQSTLP